MIPCDENAKTSKDFVHDFISSAFTDTTETIRFIDAKAGAAFVVHGLIITVILYAHKNLHQAIRTIFQFSLCLVILFVGVLVTASVLIFVSMVYLLSTIKPQYPSRAIINNLPEEDKQLWYVHNLPTLEEFYNKLINKDESAIIKLKSFELLKVSYIRNKKLELFGKGFKLLTWSFVPIVIIITVTIIFNIY